MPDSSISPTPVSLLERLRETHAEEDWRRFVRLYTPLLLYWARRLCRPPDDPPDLVQEVFTKLATELPRFRYDPTQGPPGGRVGACYLRAAGFILAVRPAGMHPAARR